MAAIVNVNDIDNEDEFIRRLVGTCVSTRLLNESVDRKARQSHRLPCIVRQVATFAQPLTFVVWQAYYGANSVARALWIPAFAGMTELFLSCQPRRFHDRRNDGDAAYATRVTVMQAMAEVIRAVSLVVKWAMAPPTAQPMGIRAIAMV